MASMKRTHLSLARGESLDGPRRHDSDRIYTLYEGWAARARRLPNGSTQIFDVLLPGDLFGLPAALLGRADHTVVALTPITVCVLDANRLTGLFRSEPSLAFSLLQGCALEQERLDDRLMLLGRLGGSARVGYLLLDIRRRLAERKLVKAAACPFPLRHAQLADAVGLSKVHVMRALRELRERGLAWIERRQLTIPSVPELARFSGYRVTAGEAKRPLL